MLLRLCSFAYLTWNIISGRLPIALKRRCGFLSYERDPRGQHRLEFAKVHGIASLEVNFLTACCCFKSLDQKPFSAHQAARKGVLANILGLSRGNHQMGQAFHSDAAASAVAEEHGYNLRLMFVLTSYLTFIGVAKPEFR